MPFIPLMRHGEEVVDRADSALYESSLSRQDKADMLTAMTIFSGLVSEKLPHVLLSRRRDIMIESAAYDIIKQEGLQEGMQQGIQEGMQQGLRQGMIQEAQEGILDNLEARFDGGARVHCKRNPGNRRARSSQSLAQEQRQGRRPRRVSNPAEEGEGIGSLSTPTNREKDGTLIDR